LIYLGLFGLLGAAEDFSFFQEEEKWARRREREVVRKLLAGVHKPFLLLLHPTHPFFWWGIFL
jgi:hypothetical protein